MITFQCSCGKKLRTKDDAAGKRVKCPACGKPVQVPGGQAAPRAKAPGAPRPPAPAPQRPEPASDFGLQPHPEDEPEDKPTGSPCPHCHVPLPVGAVICTTCGLDLRTGKAFARPKTLMEKIPWKTVWKAASSLAVLAVVAVAAVLVKNHIDRKREAARKAEQEEEGGKDTGKSAAKAPTTAPRVRVVFYPEVRATKPPPKLDPMLKVAFRHQGRRFNLGEACHEIRGAILKQVRQKLKAAELAELGAKDPLPKGCEEIRLQIKLEFAMDYKREAGEWTPKEPYVKHAQADLLRRRDVPFGDRKDYSDPNVRKTPSADELRALVAGPRRIMELDLGKGAEEAAKLIVKNLLRGLPNAKVLEQKLTKERAAEQRVADLVAKIRKGKIPPEAHEMVEKRGQEGQYVIGALYESRSKIQDVELLKAIRDHTKNPEIADEAAKLVKLLGG